MIDRAIDAPSASDSGSASASSSSFSRIYCRLSQFSVIRVAIFAVECLARAKQRRALARLDDRMLSDIGVSRADVEGELSKPFWRA